MSTQHERDTETDFDYRGARFYDADVARFNSLDPLAADFVAWSAYNYVLGNPNTYIDPDGRTATAPQDDILLDENGNEIFRIENDQIDRYFIDIDGTYVQVNSINTVKGDPKSQNPWNGCSVVCLVEDLKKIVAEATEGIEESYLSVYSGIFHESQEGGHIDFVNLFEDGTIYEIQGIYYNSHEALNYLWGAALDNLGVNINDANGTAIGYHFVAWSSEKINGGDRYARAGPVNEFNHNAAIRTGYNLFGEPPSLVNWRSRLDYRTNYNDESRAKIKAKGEKATRWLTGW